MVCGAMVAVIGAAGLSLYADIPLGDAEDAAQRSTTSDEAQLPTTPPLRFFEETPNDPSLAKAPVPPALRQSESSALSAPLAGAPDIPPEAGKEPLKTEDGSMPDVAKDGTALTSPQSPDDAEKASVSTDAATAPTIQRTAPAALNVGPRVTSEPMQPPAPQVPQDTGGLVLSNDGALGAQSQTSEDPATMVKP
ncbi:hypothetical protein P775_14580 [Puniceibacterium antarcticum]|uniref:Uncharacterized protein n=2 Tax=Puniceibacterium antarcticum TaxID=1206336 RepID=A0A2G8RCQ8_9RHOB|nr:hypothetical protein P775_14580 [Puniceibacterium antarcticum]